MACCNQKHHDECNSGCGGNTWFLIIIVLFILLAIMFGFGGF